MSKCLECFKECEYRYCKEECAHLYHLRKPPTLMIKDERLGRFILLPIGITEEKDYTIFKITLEFNSVLRADNTKIFSGKEGISVNEIKKIQKQLKKFMKEQINNKGKRVPKRKKNVWSTIN